MLSHALLRQTEVGVRWDLRTTADRVPRLRAWCGAGEAIRLWRSDRTGSSCYSRLCRPAGRGARVSIGRLLSLPAGCYRYQQLLHSLSLQRRRSSMPRASPGSRLKGDRPTADHPSTPDWIHCSSIQKILIGSVLFGCVWLYFISLLRFWFVRKDVWRWNDMPHASSPLLT